MSGQYSVKETCEVIELGVKILEAIKKSKEDNSFTWTDAANFIPAVIAAVPAIDKVNLVPKELGELDSEDQEVLRQKVLELVPEVGEGWLGFAQKALNAAFMIYELVVAYIELKKAKPANPA